MRIHSLKNSIFRFALATKLACGCALTYAQMVSLPGFYEDHFRVEATNDNNGSRLRTQFDYKADDTFFTSNSIKINHDGFENHTAIGFAQNFGTVQAKVTYKLNQFNYSSGESLSDDIYYDLQYRSLHVQHRQEKSMHVSSVGIPYNIHTAHFDFAVSHSVQETTAEEINVYSITSQFNNLKVAASWQHSGDVIWADVNSMYRLSGCWLVKLSHSDHGSTLQQQIRSEYTGRNYRLAGEYISMNEKGNKTHNVGAVDIEKTMKLAALKLRLGYDDVIDRLRLTFKVETHFVF